MFKNKLINSTANNQIKWLKKAETKMLTSLVFFIAVLTSFVKDIFAHVDSAKLQEECNIAKICRHDQVPVCGIDSCGEMRTYIDVCDMHEFNCDSKKDFVPKPAHECWVTCKRGRSFKKPLYGVNCDINKII